MKLEGFDKYYEAPEPGRSERAYAWATAIGLQDVDGLRPSQYLIDTAKRNIEGEISADEARRLVDEYYETKLGHDEPENAEEADKVSTAAAKAVSGLHRHDVVVNDGVKGRDVVVKDVINRQNDVINDVIKFAKSEEIAVEALVRDPRLSAARLSELLGVKHRQAQRIIASLKRKAGLKRRGARKNGEWYFESGVSGQ